MARSDALDHHDRCDFHPVRARNPGGPYLSIGIAIAVLCLAVLVGLRQCTQALQPIIEERRTPPPGPASALIVHPLSGTEGTPLEALTARVIASLRENDVAAIPYEIANRYRMAAQADVVAIEGDQAVLQMVVQFALPDGSAIAEDSWERVVSWSSYLAAEPSHCFRCWAQKFRTGCLLQWGWAICQQMV